jgi:16S rRNA processing protein RimM
MSAPLEPARLDPKRLVEIGRVQKPHGIKGEVRVVLHNPASDLLGEGRRVRLRPAQGEELVARVKRARPTPQGLIVTFAEVLDRNGAEALQGAGVLLSRDEFPPLDEGEFYACDVEGATVFGADGAALGEVVELLSYPTCSALRVRRADGAFAEFALVESVIARVDVEGRRVELRDTEAL